MATNYGKLDFAVAFNRQTAYPLDGNAYFESKATADAAIENAKAAGSSNSQYYYGQLITVYENGTAKVYQIQKQDDNKAILAEVGGTVDLSGYIQGSGTAKKIPVFTNASTLGNSAIAMTDQDTVKIDTSSHASLTDPALHIHHYGPQTPDDYADLMILSGLTRNPYGLRFRSHGSGTQIIQSQRIANNSECFGISLNPNGGNVAIGKQTASYKLDVNGSIGASGFVHSGLTAPEGKTKDDYVLLAGGSTKPLSEFAVSDIGDNYLPLAGGTMTEAGPIKYNQGAGGSTYANNYISAGRGYSPGSGRYGIKIVACDQNDCVSGLGQDLFNGTSQNLTYDFGVSGSASSSNVGYISFTMHKYSGNNGVASNATTAKTYHRLGLFDYNGNFGTRGNVRAPGLSITAGDATNVASATWSPNIKATWQYNSSTDCVELVW